MIVEVIRGLGLGGAETLLFERLKYAQDHHIQGYRETTVINTHPEQNFFTERIREIGINVIELSSPNPGLGMIETNRAIAKLPEVGIVVFHSPVTSYLRKLRRMFGLDRAVRLVDIVHNTRYRGVYRATGAILDTYSDAGIAVSEDVYHAPTMRSQKHPSIVLAGVNREAMREWIVANPDAPTQFRASLEVPSAHRLIVSVGRLVPHKGHHHLLGALVDPRLRQTTAVLVGTGSERESLERLATDLGVHDRVKFAGRVPDGWKWTAVADVLAHPSHFEGLPVTLMEAAAIGTPIVATDVGGVNQVFQKGGTGVLLTEPKADLLADALVSTLSNVSEISRVFPLRANHASYWDVGRFSEEFYKAISA